MLELLGAIMRRKQPPTHDLLDQVSMNFRVGLLDIDLNLHLNNANYLRFMDRCRLEHAVVTGLLQRMISAHCHVVVANMEISYIRELRPYQPFTLQTRLLGWDEKYTYYDQRFESQGKLHTHALLRAVHLHEKAVISPQSFQEITGFNRRSPALPEYINNWKAMLQAKKRYSNQTQG